MALTLFGIVNCDTVKKARLWLRDAGIAHDFHDYKKAGIDDGRLRGWVGEVGWQALLNRAGTTFRKLAPAEQADLDEARAIALMLAHPSLIRRPVLQGGQLLLVGFKPDIYAEALADQMQPAR